jgi:PAS domain S-box-containing protein
VTTRLLAKKALRDSEAKYRSLFESMTEGFALYELIEDDQARPVDWRVLEVNEAYVRHTGIPRATVIGQRISELFPAVYAEYLPVFARVVATQTPAEFETYAKTIDRYMHIVTFPLGGRLFASLIEDVSARRKAEQALRESERRLERAQEIAHLGSWELDVTADRLTWSDEVYRIFGLQPKEFAATYEAFLAAVHPDDRSAVDAAYLGSLREGRNSYEIEHRIIRRGSGEVRTVHEKCEHFRDAAGQVIRSVGMVLDITERKRAEALRQALIEQERLRLGAAVEMASEAVVMADQEGRILYVNAAFEKINRLSKDSAAGRYYFELYAGDARAAEMRACVERGEAWNGHLTLQRPGERAVELEIVVTPIKDPPGVLITERDITQEVVLEERVRQAQKMEALGTLAGGIAHDFNNILGAITINTELALLDAEAGCPARESLPLILRAAERGKELVKQIVTFSRQREWERSPLRIAPVVQEALQLFRTTVPGSVAVHETIGAENATVEAHPAQVHQILSNLCQNASLAMRGKPGRLEVKLETVYVDAAMASRHSGLKAGPYVRLAVADSGCGMSREVLGRAFEPFFTTRSPGEGSGLGLSVVHGIVKSYGGAITAYSEVGKGSTFSVFLPLLPEDSRLPDEMSAPAAETGSERILLVDDDPVQLKSLARMLEKLGYKVTARASGRTAAAAFKKNPDSFDLVVTDQTMPRMSGIEMARSLVEIRPDIPIILNTGFSEKVNAETVGRNGIRAFIMKPFTARELSGLIRKVLKGEN